MKFLRLSGAALVWLAFWCSAASAAVVYKNGNLDGLDGSAQISPSQILSNSFSLMSATTLTRVTVGLWTPANTRPETLTWSIGASPFGSELGTGSSTFSSELVAANGGFEVYLSTFDLTVGLLAGDFWLTLGDGASTGGGELGWDINFGPSLAFYQNSADSGPAASEYFRLEGTPVTDPGPPQIPEPASLALFAGGLLGVMAARLRLTRTA